MTVAIIAILAAIAVPNFLEAQVRAKVSRVKSDQRTMATALESYAVDHNRHPPSHAARDASEVNPLNPQGAGTPANPRIQRLAWLTTPVAYLTGVSLDPFAPAQGEGHALNREFPVFTYWDVPYTDYLRAHASFLGGPSEVWSDMPGMEGRRGDWSLISYGPDRRFDANIIAGNPGDGRALRVYDPTNGTISRGDIWRFGGSGAVD